MDEAEIAGRCFVVSGCQTSGIFQLVEAALDLVSQSVCEAVDGNVLLAAGAGRDDRRTAVVLNIVPDGV